ncbi:MAG: sugar transferase [Verrucomicrobiales bacterium]
MIVVAGFYLATVIRFADLLPPKLFLYLPSIIVCALLLPSTIYITGLYAQEHIHGPMLRRHLLLACSLGVMMVTALAVGSLAFDARVGRGVMVLALAITSPCILLHHALLRRGVKANPHRLACVVACREDEEEATRLAAIDKPHFTCVGVFTGGDYKPAPDSGLQMLGRIEDVTGPDVMLNVDSLVCRAEHMKLAGAAAILRSLRYQGVNMMTLIDAFEDFFQIVPLELVNEEWLLHASAKPQMLYIRKLKRAFDIIVAAALLVLLGPICLVAMLLLRFTSGGEMLFRQERGGRFGRKFTVLKLRTMRVGADADGPQWSNQTDSRVTPLGRWLRRYRIDEIPQLVNILRGEMSFVGPRPEQLDLASDIEKHIPYFNERLLMQPGLTGWAQVRFPYGSTLDDAERKLEYDLYYLKHMSLALDLFILLDTVRIIVRGGARYSPPVRMKIAVPPVADVVESRT